MKKKITKEKKCIKRADLYEKLTVAILKKKDKRIGNSELRFLSSSLLQLCRKLSLTHAHFLIISFFRTLYLKDFNDKYIWYFQRVLPVTGREWLVHLHVSQACNTLQYKNIFLQAPNFLFFILWVSHSVHSPLTSVEKMRWEQFKEKSQ